VDRIQAFLDSVGAKYRFHDSHKSDSAYFHVKEPPAVAEDPRFPDVVDTRISDHALPPSYGRPDLDVSVPKPRPKAVSPDFAIKLLKDFLKGKVDIEEGKVIPVDASLGRGSVFGLRGRAASYRKALFLLSGLSQVQSKLLYHGTPNKVGEVGNFSTEFVGAGEGLQVYGWGLYFAEDKKVSEDMYRKRLSDSGARYFYKGELINKATSYFHDTADAKHMILRYLARLPVDQRSLVLQDLRRRFPAWAATALGEFRDFVPSDHVDVFKSDAFYVVPSDEKSSFRIWDTPNKLDRVQGHIQQIQELLDSIDVTAFRKEKATQRGYTYTVNLKVPDDLFIDWDVSWGEQPAKVVERLLKAKTPVTKRMVHAWSTQSDRPVGGDFLRSLYKAMGGSGNSFRDKAIAKAEAMDLRKTGIHGVRYWDGNSRRRQSGFHNYVIYDENDIETVLHPEQYSDGQLGLFTKEEMVIPSKVAAASFQRILSAFQQGEPVTLAHLADLINATQADFHFLHFYAGGDGNWDCIHDICSDYYLRLAEDYDDVAELCLQVGADVTHPNDSASAAGFENSRGSFRNTFEYDAAMQIVQDRIHNLVDVAAEVAGQHQNRDVNSTAVRNYLEGFIEEWSKEADFKLKGRLGGEPDFGGAYRDRVPDESLYGGEPEGELITGDAEEDPFQ
jgi:DNA-binding ferritin-like protein